MDVRLRLADGRTLDVNITGAPLRSPTGEITGAVAISRDVTERRRLERDIRFQASMLGARPRRHLHVGAWWPNQLLESWRGVALWLHAQKFGWPVTHDLLRTNHGVQVKEFEAAIERKGEWTGEAHPHDAQRPAGNGPEPAAGAA